MRPRAHDQRPTFRSRLARHGVLAIAMVLGFSMAAGAQSPPPVQGTMALEGTMKQFYRGVNVVVVSTIDGVEHVYHFTKNLVVHGGSGPDELAGLSEGKTVVVHYTGTGADAQAQEIDVVGEQGLKITEGVVTQIDRRKNEITIRFDNGTTEKLQVTSRAAAEDVTEIEESNTNAARIVVYYSDESGRKVAHYVRKAR